MTLISKIYTNKIYTLSIVILALVSLFETLPKITEYSIYGIFIFDLIIGTILYIRNEPNRSFVKYIRHFIFDIIACIPFSTMGIFKLFRLIRVSRLIKLRRVNNTTIKIKFENLFSFNTFQEFSIYLFIYFIGNIYLFSQIEHKSFLDSIYWLIETMTSIGYWDIVPTHSSTKILGMLLMLIGVATIGYFNGVITTTIVTHLNHKKEE